MYGGFSLYLRNLRIDMGFYLGFWINAVRVCTFIGDYWLWASFLFGFSWQFTFLCAQICTLHCNGLWGFILLARDRLSLILCRFRYCGLFALVSFMFVGSWLWCRYLGMDCLLVNISYFDGDAIVSGGSLLVFVFISIYLRLDFVFKEMLFYYMVWSGIMVYRNPPVIFSYIPVSVLIL